MKWQLIDLTLPLETTLSEPEPVEIDTVSHAQGAALLMQGSELPADSFPDGLGLSLERIRLTSHSGTHVDAPLHYGPFSEGHNSRSIDEMPLDWFFGPALVLDCIGEEHNASETVTLDEVKQALESQNLHLAKGDIVFIYTGADRLWGTRDYFTAFRGMSLEATAWLLEKGIRVIGIDSFGFDAPFQKMIQTFIQTLDQRVLWPCHMLGREKEYCQIERLANLSALPKHTKFWASCFPLKLKRCGAGPSRVVAFLTEDQKNGV